MKNINNETEFENHIREDILKDIFYSNSDFKLFDFKKAVDVLIAKNGQDPELFFIEIKYHKKNHGRLGFGQAEGKGFQPEVLEEKTAYFEKNLRWILGHEDCDEYWIADNDLIRKNLNAGQVGKKHNGIQPKFFKEVEPISRNELVKELKDWMKIK